MASSPGAGAPLPVLPVCGPAPVLPVSETRQVMAGLREYDVPGRSQVDTLRDYHVIFFLPGPCAADAPGEPTAVRSASISVRTRPSGTGIRMC